MMKAITASDARQRLFPIIREVVDEESTVHITSKHGTAVLMSEAEYRGLMETVYLLTNPVGGPRLLDAIAEFESGSPGIRVDLDALRTE